MTTLNFLKSTQVYASTNTEAVNSLGEVFWEDGKGYILVQAAANIAAAAKKILISAIATDTRTFQVNTTTTANSTLVAGVVPASIATVSSTAGQLDSGDVFALQVSGDAEVISAAAIAANVLVGTSTTAGKADDASITAGIGSIGTSIESAAGADESVGVRLKGLI